MSAHTVIRQIEWAIGPDTEPDREQDCYAVECAVCLARSPQQEIPEEARDWIFDHVGRVMCRTGHDGRYVWQKAAALMESLARNHAMVDGNKRLSWYATWVFLHLNGHPLARDLDVDEAERFVLAVCQGQREMREIAKRLPGFAAVSRRCG